MTKPGIFWNYKIRMKKLERLQSTHVRYRDIMGEPGTALSPSQGESHSDTATKNGAMGNQQYGFVQKSESQLLWQSDQS